MFGLDVDTLRAIREAISQLSSIEKVLIYGSRAKGNYRPGSDIDITLIGKGLTLNNSIYPLMDKLEDLNLPYQFDISIFNQLKEDDFIDHILRVGKTFYEREKEVSEKWKIIPLGDICSIQLGRTPARYNSTLWDSKKKTTNVWLSIADLPQKLNAHVTDSKEYISDKGAKNGRIVPEGTLLVSFKLTLGRLAYAGRDLYTNEAIASLTILDNQPIIKAYLYWYLTFFDWGKAAEGEEKIKGKTLNKAKLKVLHVLVPPLPEQKRIVAILDKAFATIETAIVNTKKNIANAQELFRSQLEQVFNNAVVSAGWDKTTIGVACMIGPNKQEAKAKLNVKDEVSFVPMKDIGTRQKFLNAHQSRPLGSVYGSYTFFTDNDVLLAKITPCFQNGKFGIARNLKNGIGFGSSEFFVFRCLSKISPEYLFYSLSRKNFIDAGVARMSGAVGQQRVPPEFVKNYPISFPRRSVQKQIVATLDKTSANTEALIKLGKQKLTHLADLKQSLLHRAFTGALAADKKIAGQPISGIGI